MLDGQIRPVVFTVPTVFYQQLSQHLCSLFLVQSLTVYPYTLSLSFSLCHSIIPPLLPPTLPPPQLLSLSCVVCLPPGTQQRFKL